MKIKSYQDLRYLWLAIAAILSFFIGGKWNVPLAAWIAPIFFIRFFRDSEKAGRNALLIWFVAAISTIVSWQGATAMSFISPIAEPLFFLFATLINLIPLIIDRVYYRRFGSSAWLTLVFPVAATAVDFFSSNGSPFGTFGAAAYSQRGFLAAMQIASVAGLWGVAFVMNWFASLINHLWESGFKFTRLSLSFACLLILILGLGFGRILLPTQPQRTALIAGFSLPNGTLSGVMEQLNTSDKSRFIQAADKIHAQELAQIRKMADAGANIVVLQEGAGMGFTDQVEKLISDTSTVAKEKNIYVVLPVIDLGKTPFENVVHIIDPSGNVVLTHVKYGGNQFEGSLKGDGILQTIDSPYGKLSAIICWDADFPASIKQAGEQKVDLLFVPSNDWAEVRNIHAGMSTFRAVENGMAIFRQTGQGVSSAVDVYGNTLNRADGFEESTSGFAGIQTISLPIGSVDTAYASIGDMFGNLTLLGTVGLLVGLFVTRQKKA